MNAHNTSDGIARLEKSPRVYYIDSRTKGSSSFVSKTQTIYWNNTSIIESDGIWRSPATSLDHEVAHAINYDNSLNSEESKASYNNKLSTHDSNYGNLEEKDVIENREQSTARKHGEIRDDQVTRNNHFGKPLQGDVSNKTPDEIGIIIKEHNNLF